jgi:hypothetical protein
MTHADDTQRKFTDEPGRKSPEDAGPKSPDVERPAPSSPLKDRFKKIDPDQAKKYRQRSGQ